MKPKISIRKWDLSEGNYPIGLIYNQITLPFSSIGYQVVCNGVVIARSSDKNQVRRVAYHLKTKWDK